MSTYEPIASQTLGSAAASVTFSSIPQNYTDLILVESFQFSATGAQSVMNFGDSSTLYSTTTLRGDGSAANSARFTNDSGIQNSPGNTNGTANVSVNCIRHIMNYSNSVTNKTVIQRFNDSSAQTFAVVALWRNTSAINTIKLTCSTGNYNAGSTFTIYGVAAGNSSAKATGGNIVTTDGSYWYHTFTSSGTFIPSQALTADYLVVAGGGGGGGYYGGGGGAGGYRTSIGGSTLSLSANTVYPAIIGGGGIGSANTSIKGTNGSDSIFSTITSTAGGGGASRFNITGSNGGSGGGGSRDDTTGTSGAGGSASPSGQGNAGATAGTTNGGGGGGASAAGSNENGGNGSANSISGTSITYAGGGGGGRGASAGGTGGTGGGGAGGNDSTVAIAGTVNLGGGGGGGAISQGGGKAGGSGIIIIRYAV
jgi:hypothetical protein